MQGTDIFSGLDFEIELLRCSKGGFFDFELLNSNKQKLIAALSTDYAIANSTEFLLDCFIKVIAGKSTGEVSALLQQS